MILILEAFSGPEGIGIVRSDDRLRLLRPPYLLRDSPVLPEDSLRDAVLRIGYSVSGQEFNDWNAITEYLKAQVVEQRRAAGKDIPEVIPDKEILGAASEKILTRYLDQVEQDLLPRRMFDHADNLLFAFLVDDISTKYPSITNRAVRLLRLSRSARENFEAREATVSVRDLRFFSLEKHAQIQESTELADHIRRRGNILALVS